MLDFDFDSRLIKSSMASTVESGFKTFEEVFLSDTVLANGQTFATWAAPQLQRQAEGECGAPIGDEARDLAQGGDGRDAEGSVRARARSAGGG